MRRLIAVALVLLSAANVGAGVQVRLSGDRVDVTAQNAPLSEILEALARETKTKLVYEGTPPRQLMFVDLKDRTPAEALLSILDGQGVAFAVAFDPSGTRVLTLLMPAAGSGVAAASGPTPRPMPTPPERPMREPVVEEQPMEDGVAEPDAGEAQMPPDTGRPNMLPPKSERPPAPAPGVIMPGTGAADYPTSTFAPKMPTPEPNKPKAESTPPPFNP